MTRKISMYSGALALCLTAFGPVQAQEIRPAPPVTVAAEQDGLTVHGHAELKVKPDIAYVTVGVVTQARDSASAVQDNATRATALLAALKQAGLADKDVQSESYAVEPQYDYQQSPAVLTGYQVTNSFQVTVRDLTHVGAVIDKATGAGSNQVNDVTFDLADRTGAESQALGLAVSSAHAKADVMAHAAGISLGRLLDLSEGSATAFQPLVLNSFAVSREAKAAATPVAPAQISITADVTAFYAIGL